jgi:DNA-binding response OmpR family regulator
MFGSFQPYDAPLSAKAEHVDRVRGLVRGADDYVTNPLLSLLTRIPL